MSTSDAVKVACAQDESSLSQQLLDGQRQVFEGIVQGRDKLGLLNTVCEQLNALLPEAQTLVLKQRHGGRVEVLAAPTLTAAQRRQLSDMLSSDLEVSPCAAGMFQAGLQIIEDVRHDARWSKVRRLDDPLDMVSCWSHGVRNAEGEVVGALAVVFSKSRQPDALTQHLIVHAAHLVEVVLHVQAQTQQLRQLLDRDPLTRLYNRERLRRDVEGLFQRHEPFGCLYIDLDRFKDINDAHGHGIGDQLLVEAARRLESCLVDIPGRLYRFGGDEFIIITQVCQLPDPYAAMEQLCQRVIERLQAPLTLSGHTFRLSASMGISCGVEADGNFYELLRMADAALWSAKSAGRRTWRFFEREMVDNLEESLQLEADLQRALGNDSELDVHYQPILDARTGGVATFEALVRWQHPEFGMVRPDRFIAVAEKSGLIRQLDEKVLELVLTDLYDWINVLGTADFTVAINLSALELERAHIERLVDKVRDSNLGRHIEFEMTETLMMADTEETTSLIHMIRESGIAGLAMDDFGTGYSSIGYLKKFPVDKLKIDRSLVRDVETDPSDLAIARAVCALGRALGLKVVAEGVETDTQRAILVDEGVNLLQGYLFARPMPGEAVIPWLESRMKQCMLVN